MVATGGIVFSCCLSIRLEKDHLDGYSSDLSQSFMLTQDWTSKIQVAKGHCDLSNRFVLFTTPKKLLQNQWYVLLKVR